MEWAQQTKGEEGREKEGREEGRDLVGLQQGGLGLSLSSTAFLSRGVTQSWLGGLQDSFARTELASAGRNEASSAQTSTDGARLSGQQ